MDPALTISVFGIGSAALAFWVVVRFPSFGPQTFPLALLLMGAASLAQPVLLGLVRPMMGTLGVPGALLLVILPALTVLFWTAGCMIRSLVALAAPYER
jgi:hypothetical protein